MHRANTAAEHKPLIRGKEVIKEKKMHPPAPELSVRACQTKVTARHVQCAKSNMCAAVAAHARVVRGILPDEATQRFKSEDKLRLEGKQHKNN